jgi:hypothetical protein
MLRTEENVMKLQKSCSSKQNRQHVFVRDMLRNGFREFASIFFPRNGIPSLVLLCGTVQHGIPRVFCSAEWFRTEFGEFASIFVPWYRIPSILLLCGTVRTGIPRVFCSAKQSEFRRRNQLFRLFHLPRNNFCRKLTALSAPLTNGSGTVRPKKLQILRIRNIVKSYLARTKQKRGKGENDSQFVLFQGRQLVAFSSDLVDIEIFSNQTKVEVHFLVNGQASP